MWEERVEKKYFTRVSLLVSHGKKGRMKILRGADIKF